MSIAQRSQDWCARENFRARSTEEGGLRNSGVKDRAPGPGGRDFSGARSLYERALAIREKALGPEHPNTASSLNNLASLLRDLISPR